MERKRISETLERKREEEEGEEVETEWEEEEEDDGNGLSAFSKENLFFFFRERASLFPEGGFPGVKRKKK